MKHRTNSSSNLPPKRSRNDSGSGCGGAGPVFISRVDRATLPQFPEQLHALRVEQHRHGVSRLQQLLVGDVATAGSVRPHSLRDSSCVIGPSSRSGARPVPVDDLGGSQSADVQRLEGPGVRAGARRRAGRLPDRKQRPRRFPDKKRSESGYSFAAGLKRHRGLDRGPRVGVAFDEIFASASQTDFTAGFSRSFGSGRGSRENLLAPTCSRWFGSGVRVAQRSR